MALMAVKVLLGASIVTRWCFSIHVSKAVYEQGLEYYQQGLAEYRKSDNNFSLAFILLREACERTNYSFPIVHDYAFSLHAVKEHVENDVAVTALEQGIVAQLDLLEQATYINATSYNSMIFDHKREISLYANHLIDVYDAMHEHTGLGWEELGLVVRSPY